MAHPINMISSFFAGRGEVFFYNLEAARAHLCIAGTYEIIQRHENGAPPSDTFPCIDEAESPVESSSPTVHQQQINSESDKTKTFRPSANHQVQCKLGFNGNWGDRRLESIVFTYDGQQSVTRGVALYPVKRSMYTLGHEYPSTQAGLIWRSNMRLQHRNSLLDPKSPLQEPVKALGDVSGSDAVRADGSVVSYGFVIDEDFTRDMRVKDPIGSYDKRWGFEFVQIELPIQRIVRQDDGSPSNKAIYAREVIVAIKVADDEDTSGGCRVANSHLLKQEFTGFTQMVAAQISKSKHKGIIVDPSSYGVTCKRDFTLDYPTCIFGGLGSPIQFAARDQHFDIYEDETSTVADFLTPQEAAENARMIHVELKSDMNKIKWMEPRLKQLGIVFQSKRFNAHSFEIWLDSKRYDHLPLIMRFISNLLVRRLMWVQRRISRKKDEYGHSLVDPEEELDSEEDRWDEEAEDVELQNDTFPSLLLSLKDAQSYVKNRSEGIINERRHREEVGMGQLSRTIPRRQDSRTKDLLLTPKELQQFKDLPLFPSARKNLTASFLAAQLASSKLNGPSCSINPEVLLMAGDKNNDTGNVEFQKAIFLKADRVTARIVQDYVGFRRESRAVLQARDVAARRQAGTDAVLSLTVRASSGFGGIESMDLADDAGWEHRFDDNKENENLEASVAVEAEEEQYSDEEMEY